MDWQNLIEDWVAERINRIIEEMGPDRRREYYREQRSVLQSTRLRFWMDYGWGIRRFEKFLLRIAHNNAMIIYIKEVIIMPNIMPITDLRKTNEISEMCHKSQEPVFITKNGYGDLVVMSIESYERLIGDMRIDAAIMEAEHEVQEGAELLDAKEALAGLRKKHGK